jgi:hypothetical protein
MSVLITYSVPSDAVIDRNELSSNIVGLEVHGISSVASVFRMACRRSRRDWMTLNKSTIDGYTQLIWDGCSIRCPEHAKSLSDVSVTVTIETRGNAQIVKEVMDRAQLLIDSMDSEQIRQSLRDRLAQLDTVPVINARQCLIAPTYTEQNVIELAEYVESVGIGWINMFAINNADCGVHVDEFVQRELVDIGKSISSAKMRKTLVRASDELDRCWRLLDEFAVDIDNWQEKALLVRGMKERVGM